MAYLRPFLGAAALAVVVVLAFNWGFSSPRVTEDPAAEPPVISDIFDPVAAGEETPPGFRQVLARDSIEPIYDPVNVDADQVDWDDDTLVLGVEVDGEARAYPIRPLNRREIVNDRIAGTPILASW